MPPPRPAAKLQGSASQATRDRQAEALADFRARRVHRRLEELERTNPTDIPASSFVPTSSVNGQAGPGGSAASKKKQSGNVRKILYARKSLNDWIEELPPDPRPPYLTATAPPPTIPPRPLCSSCGYIGAYKCPRCGEWSCDRTCLETHQRDGGCGVGM